MHLHLRDVIVMIDNVFTSFTALALINISPEKKTSDAFPAVSAMKPRWM